MSQLFCEIVADFFNYGQATSIVLESIFVVFLVIYIAVRLISTVNIKFLRENI